MPGKTARALCPVCQEPMPPDETECENCGAFVIDEAVVRLCRAFGINREKALQLFEKGFRHPTQLRDRDVDDVLTKGENGLLFLCTNCGGFVATGDSKCPRCGAEFEAEPEAAAPEPDILDLVLCPVCGADNETSWKECEICGEPLSGPAPEEKRAAASPRAEPTLEKVDAFLEDLEAAAPKSTSSVATAEKSRGLDDRRVPKVSKRPKIARLASGREPAKPAAAPPSERAIAAPPPKARPAPRARQSAAHVGVRPSETVRVLRRRRTWTPPPPEFTGAIVTASAMSLYLARTYATAGMETGVGWGVAFVLAALSVYAVAAIPTTRGPRSAPADLGLLAAGVLPGLAALGAPAEIAPYLIVAATVPMALATRRLRKTPARSFLVVAAALGLLGFAVDLALGLPFASTPAWTLGLLAYAPWPAILVGEEIRRRQFSLALRRELVRAERNIDEREYARSLEDYDRAIELSRKGMPGEDLPWYGKGATLILLGRYEEALEAIDTSLDINPYSEVAWLNKGNALMKLGRFVDALRCFNAALKVNPGYEVAWNNKGNALARMGHYAEALRCYEKALAIDPEYRGSWVNKGYVLTKLGRYDEAASCADRALRLNRRRSEVT